MSRGQSAGGRRPSMSCRGFSRPASATGALLVALVGVFSGCSGRVSGASAGSDAGTAPGLTARAGATNDDEPDSTQPDGVGGASFAEPSPNDEEPEPSNADGGGEVTPDDDVMGPDAPGSEPSAGPFDAREFSRLTRAELAATLRAAFDLEVDVEMIPVDGRVGVYTSNALVSPDPVHPYLLLAEDIAQQLVPARLPACESVEAESCLREALVPSLERLYRRPLHDAEITAWARMIEQLQEEEASAEEATRAVLASALVSPDFLFRAGPSSGADAEGRRLAERLGYALLDAPPDEELLSAGSLLQLQAQVDRIASDPRAVAVVARFVAQWLDLDTDLRLEDSGFAESAAYQEWLTLIEDALQNDVPISELLAGDWGFVHRDNLEAYGLEDFDAEGDDVMRVQWPADSNRRGVLAQELLASSTRHPDSSRRPIFRGLLVRRSLLCNEIPAPSAELVNLAGEVSDRTVDTRCATCHRLIDPIGRTFASLDSDHEGPVLGADLMASGELDGSYDDLASLLEAVAASREFAECFSRNWLGFFLERPLDDVDQAWVTRLADSVQAGGGLTAIIEQTVAKLEASSATLEPWCAGE